MTADLMISLHDDNLIRGISTAHDIPCCIVANVVGGHGW